MKTKRLDWIQTYSGLKVFPLDPKPNQICIEDIAHALSNICRFTGHTRDFYSVAQHSVMVASNVSNASCFWGVLHDASEAYLCDIARPVKIQPELKAYREAEDRLMAVICKKFGLPREMPDEVRLADRRALRTEARDLGLYTKDWDGYVQDVMPFGFAIRPLNPKDAENNFLTWYNVSRRY